MANAERFSEEYRRMLPEQLNSELHQIFGFVYESVRLVKHGSYKIDVVSIQEAERRHKGEVYNVLKKKLTALLDFAPITPRFRQSILRLFWVHHVMLSGFDEEGREYADLLLQKDTNGIFDSQQAKEIERVWYRRKFNEVRKVIRFIVRHGSSTKAKERWRIESMGEWRQQFVACHGEEP